MTALVPQNFGPVSTKFANTNTNDDLSSGIQSSFGLIGYKGKVWSIRYRGDDTPLMREDGDGPKSSIEVVVLSASKAVSKVWYEQGYVEGSTAAPDCFSNNGIAPDPASLKKQCDSCALCPMNQWGSRMTPAGKNGKACADSKRLAVVPMQDLQNEMFGGPMLLRVPAASLQDLAMYGQKMSQLGYPYYAIATRIAFDTAESYPKFVFGAIRPLTDAEADIVLVERTNHTVERILSENEFATPASAETPSAGGVFEQEPEAQVTTKQTPAKSTVGDQARAAAAANKKRVEDEQKAAAKAQAETKPDQADPKEATKTKKQQEAAAKKAALEAEIAAMEAADEEVTTEGNTEVESEEDRELREMEEKMAAMKAKKAAAVASTGATQQKAETTPAQTQASTVTASPSDPEENDSVASDFESELDGLLDNLLPS